MDYSDDNKEIRHNWTIGISDKYLSSIIAFVSYVKYNKEIEIDSWTWEHEIHQNRYQIIFDRRSTAKHFIYRYEKVENEQFNFI